ncbi:Male sterility NAD-binding [Penicillium malachiteum]|uniref:Male sterility NAD-binding n=1 Tax=Penicillium malachiteum TaxID=1324776 RepID=A0AAD6HDT9_9EURO|nr:Male sterility NAD-binding [Penicillium malachiteum]
MTVNDKRCAAYSDKNSQIGSRILLNYIQDTAVRHPDRPAVHQLAESQDGRPDIPQNIVLSYGDIVALVNTICWQVHHSEVMSTSSHVVAYVGPSDLRQLLISLVATKMGYQALLLSPRVGPSSLQDLIQQCDASALIYDRQFASIANDVSQAANIGSFEIADLLQLLQGPWATKGYRKDGYADHEKILHTTGSTGKPKPVPISHSMLAATDGYRLLSQKYGDETQCQLEIMSKADTVYVAFPLYHVAGFALSCYLLFSSTTLMFGYPNQPPSLSMLRIALSLRKSNLQGVMIPPSIVDEVSRSSSLMEHISKLSWIFSGGGSIGQKEGDTIVTKTRLFNGLGSTECGSFSQFPTDPSYWNYFNFHPSNGIDWRQISSEEENDDTEFELVIRREESCQPYQGVFHNFPNLDEWATKDVFRKHPTVENLWEYRYRIDDVLVFATGEKMNPVPLESRVSGVSGIKAALGFGNQQRFPGLLLEIEEPTSDTGNLYSLPSKLQSLVKSAVSVENARSSRDGHIHDSMIIVASKGKPFVRTSKGTVQRNNTLECYKTEIDALYDSIDLSDLGSLHHLRLDRTSEDSLACGLTDFITQLISNTAPMNKDSDIFSVGIDSMQAQIFTAVVNKEITSTWQQGEETRPSLEISTIYAHPTPRKLARYILQGELSQQKEEETQFHELLQRHLSDIPTTSVSTVTKSKEINGKHVLVTGTTGFIGSCTLTALLQQEGVERVTCLNRKLPDSTRQAEDPAKTDTSVNCEHLKADLAKKNLGLTEPMYHALIDSVTDILHCQWAVDFNKPLQYFEPNITGVNNLIKFASDAKSNAQIVFVSSVAAVKNWRGPGPVPEVKLESHEFAEMGYGQSKLIASLLLDQASASLGIPTTICRLGQVTGAIDKRMKEHSQTWPRRDWFPTLLATSISLGCIPDSLGPADEIDWIPVNTIAEALSDLVCSSNEIPRTANGAPHSKYYHLVNPTRTSYTNFVSFLATRLSKREPLKIISLTEWVSLLAGQAQDGAKLQSPIPGLSLLGFFEKLAFTGGRNSIVLDTTMTEQRLPCLETIGGISEEWMGMWLDEWKLI